MIDSWVEGRVLLQLQLSQRVMKRRILKAEKLFTRQGELKFNISSGIVVNFNNLS